MLTAGQPVGTGRASCLCWQPLQGRSTLMNQADLIAAVAAHASLTKTDAGKAVEAVVSTITEALKQGEEVRIAGFGTFGISEHGGQQFSDRRANHDRRVQGCQV